MRSENTPFAFVQVSVVVCMLLSAMAVGAEQNSLDGRWQTGEDNSIVEVFEQDGEYFGKLVSSDNPNARIGTEILRNFTAAGGTWKGKLYAAKRDKLLDAVITPKADTLNIEVKAGMVSRKLAWQRVQP